MPRPWLRTGSLCRSCAGLALCAHRPCVLRLCYGEVAGNADPTALPHPEEVKVFRGEVKSVSQ